MRIKISTKTHLYQLSLSRVKLGSTWTTGTMNRTEDGMYICYLDYDLTEPSHVKDELRHLQQIMDIGTFYIFQSSEKRFHAISLSKLTAAEFMQLLEASSCDAAFKKVPRFRSTRNWVLRCFSKLDKPKPRLIGIIRSKSSRKQSTAHHKLLKIIYPEIKIKNPDNLKKVSLISYLTADRS